MASSNDKNRQHYQGTLDRLSKWLAEASAEEIKSFVGLVEKAKAYLHAAEDLSHDEAEKVMHFFRRDLEAFWQHQQEDAAESPWWHSVTDSFWHALSEITDRSQVEWKELELDIQHSGQYQAGELVGLGELYCLECGERKRIWHPEVLTECTQCEHDKFERHMLEP